MRGRDLLIIGAFVGSFTTIFNGLGNYWDREAKRAEDDAFEQLALRRDQAKWRCAADDRCTLSILFPDSAGSATRVSAVPAGTAVLPAGAAVASVEQSR